MPFSTVRLIMRLFVWISYGIGISLNGILVRLIVRHTPTNMKIYSNILLQTCTTDIALLVMAFLFQKYSFTTKQGENQVFLDGPFIFRDPEYRGWNLLALICTIFLIYVSLLGYVSQFIYRYLVLNREKKISAFKYFSLFGIILLFPLLYCANLYICYYPPVEHQFLEDQSVADLLGLNLTERVALTGVLVNDWKMKAGFYYILSISTSSYIIMIILAFLMDRFLREQTKKITTSKLTEKMIEMNKQISRNLFIQASMPFFIYFSILFYLCIILFRIDVSRWHWLQYYNIFSFVPMFLPSALNPMVSIFVIQHFRKIFVKDIKQIVKCFKMFFSSRKPANVTQQSTVVAPTHSTSTILIGGL